MGVIGEVKGTARNMSALIERLDHEVAEMGPEAKGLVKDLRAEIVQLSRILDVGEAAAEDAHADLEMVRTLLAQVKPEEVGVLVGKGIAAMQAWRQAGYDVSKIARSLFPQYFPKPES